MTFSLEELDGDFTLRRAMDRLGMNSWGKGRRRGRLRSPLIRVQSGTPKSELRHFEAALLEEKNGTHVQTGLEARMVEHPDGDAAEKYVLCRSTTCAEKERAMLARQSEGLEGELAKIRVWLARSPRSDQEKVGRRIGRALGKYPAAARVIEARVEHGAQGRACALCFFSHLEAGERAHLRRGA